MKLTLEISKAISAKDNLAIIVNSKTNLKQFLKKAEEIEYVKKGLEDSTFASLNQLYRNLYFIKEIETSNYNKKIENLRICGCELLSELKKEKIKSIQLCGNEDEILALAEGLMLTNYQFLKYKTKKNQNALKTISLYSEKTPDKNKVNELYHVVEATCIARDLVNEPVIYLTAEQLSEEIKKLGKEAGFKVEIFNKSKIESLKMGGLLSVNFGSVDPPTFNILEYKPSKPKNKKPYILVGKGVVYDTGGLSIKPSESMDKMKCDMAGAAAVAGAIYAIAKNKIPVHVIGLIPATDNRLNGNAVTPGDVITISNGKTVEVLNTDAEGRLILADALSYAAKYKPELVIDLATLTGAAARAIGKEGIVFMGNAPAKIKNELMQTGEEVYERLVEFPLWEEYGKQIESDIADIKNIGGGDAGAITAGKFLEHFVDYDWLHLDIAGSAFLTCQDFYRPKNGTGAGVRLLYNFLKKLSNGIFK
jgi:leucyl aminopeptidase